ncbi:alkaline phosphatase [Aeromicrobium sp. 179-A 4D2 NHS]|uniref:alkaline phosphatase n=1 Tax=Aeromicrobium sp. 179-A 4D2 NHS TaxID=3142375 RepID=UPI0039A01F3D
MTRMRNRTRTLVTVGTAGLLLGGAVVGSIASGERDLSRHGGAARLAGDQTKAVKKAIDGSRPDNVILIVGDGMGDSEITSARNYVHGAAGRFPGIDALPLTGQYTTYSLTKDGKPDYVPDSAATGSAWATGTKTYDNAVSVDIEGKPQRTLLELAKRAGYKTGNVSTAELQDATPAVQVAHVTARSCYGPVATTRTCPANAKENGGAGSITEQLLDTRPDVSLGGGAATFAETATAGRWKGQTLRRQAESRGYRIVEDLDALSSVRSADQDRPLLGLFAPGNFPVRWTGPAATPDGGRKAPVACEENPARTASLPSLADMTEKSIELLDRRNRKGFFLQVEGASIDKRNHSSDACGQIGETLDLDEAVKVALDYAKKDGNTTVIVTADHAHTSQIVEAGSTTPGSTVNLLTRDGQPMTINYATSASAGSQQHTGSQLRIAAYGPRAANVVGLTDQTDVFFTIRDALRLGR